jgi:hypothetical protein
MVEIGPGIAGNCETPARGRTAGRPKWALIALVIVYCLEGLVAGPLGDTLFRVSPWLAYLGGGMLGAILILHAAWAALGPPPAFQRIMWTSAAFVAALYAFLIGMSFQEGRHAANDALLPLLAFVSLFLLFTSLLVPVRLFAAWQIAHEIDESDRSPARANQFRIKDLMIAAAILAITLGVGRCFISFDLQPMRGWNYLYPRLIEPLEALALILLPMVPIVGICLAVQSGKMRLTWVLAVMWGIGDVPVMLLLMHVLPNRPLGGEWSELVTLLVGQQIGCLIASFLSVVVIGCAGYRLVRRKRSL